MKYRLPLFFVVILCACVGPWAIADKLNIIPNSDGLHSRPRGSTGEFYIVNGAYKDPNTGTYIIRAIRYIPIVELGRLLYGTDVFLYGSPQVGFHEIKFSGPTKTADQNGGGIEFEGSFVNDPRIGDWSPVGHLMLNDSKVNLNIEGFNLVYFRLNSESTKLLTRAIHDRIIPTEKNLLSNGLRLERLLWFRDNTNQYIAIVAPINEKSLSQRVNLYRIFIGKPGEMRELPLQEFPRYAGPSTDFRRRGDVLKSKLRVVPEYDRARHSKSEIYVANALPDKFSYEGEPFYFENGKRHELSPLERVPVSLIDSLSIPGLRVVLHTPADLITNSVVEVEFSKAVNGGTYSTVSTVKERKTLASLSEPDFSGLGPHGTCKILLRDVGTKVGKPLHVL